MRNPTHNSATNEWTVMFYFASDCALSSLTVSQVKAIKDAGFQKNTDVLLYFDSNQKGVPTRLFNVNDKRRGKPRRTRIGDSTDPFVHNMTDDVIVPAKIRASNGPGSAALRKALKNPDSMTARQSLENFILYCRESHRANHYLLYVVGHGLVVANDSFLFDDNPASAITLVQLGNILRRFTRSVRQDGGTFEMLAMHSCSMSAIEVAYELKDTAKYMMASQGLSFVGSWPYRQLLKKTFNTTEGMAKTDRGLANSSDIETLLDKLHELSLYHAIDFAFSGYSLDLTLCSLDKGKIAALMVPLQKLIVRLKESLPSPPKDSRRAGAAGKLGEMELIMLAHLRSQSYWQEDYTDLYDFCRCLRESCNLQDDSQKTLATACTDVMDVLEIKARPFDGLIVESDNFGWEYQYSHGLSIYFPWSKPIGDVTKSPVRNYEKYAFSRDLRGNSWLTFLNKYWKVTMRAPANPTVSSFLDKMLTRQNVSFLDSLNKPGGSYNKPGGGYNKPGGGYDDTGCTCPSIKNYPTIVKLGRRIRRLAMSEKAQRAFK